MIARRPIELHMTRREAALVHAALVIVLGRAPRPRVDDALDGGNWHTRPLEPVRQRLAISLYADAHGEGGA